MSKITICDGIFDHFTIAGTVIQRRDLMDVICVSQMDTDSFLICYKSMYIYSFLVNLLYYLLAIICNFYDTQY